MSCLFLGYKEHFGGDSGHMEKIRQGEVPTEAQWIKNLISSFSGFYPGLAQWAKDPALLQAAV